MENLLPALPDALAPGKRKPLHSVATGFGPATKLHLVHALAGHDAGTALDVIGQCLCRDANGEAWRLLAYVAPSASEFTSYADRQAARFPEAGQMECWFGSVYLFFTEIDITDHAESLLLELGTVEAEATITPHFYQPATGLRRAA
jgi:hypothetical protein